MTIADYFQCPLVLKCTYLLTYSPSGLCDPACETNNMFIDSYLRLSQVVVYAAH